MTELAVPSLHSLDHRGAKAADGTGDGAGVMTRIPFRLLERELRARDPEVPAEGHLGLIMAFLPRDDADRCRK
jgi:glutamate synthase domain-containing protein 1